jgi:hypothetical protein
MGHTEGVANNPWVVGALLVWASVSVWLAYKDVRMLRSGVKPPRRHPVTLRSERQHVRVEHSGVEDQPVGASVSRGEVRGAVPQPVYVDVVGDTLE